MSTVVTIAVVIAAGRVLIGLALLLAPGKAGVAWLGTSVASGPGAIAVRLLGARDLALGAGLIAEATNDGSIFVWLLAGVLADLADAIVCATSGDALNRSTKIGTALIAFGSAIAGGVLAALICLGQG